jgi:hypothetical protein
MASVNSVVFFNKAMKDIRKMVGHSRTGTLLFFLFCISTLHGQTEISIKAAATVIEAAGIELITLKDITIDQASAQNGVLNISPLTDETAGKMLVKGKINSSIRLSYMNQLSLVNSSGDGTIIFQYVVSGNKSDNQRASASSIALGKTANGRLADVVEHEPADNGDLP